MANEILGHDATVVLVGNINPPIFTPAWLHLNGLISEEDMDQADVNVIHPQISNFKVSRFSMRVQPNRFALSTSEEPFISIADWVKIIFGEILPHTPLQQAGINYGGHFAAGSQQQRHALGRALAPIEPWGDWGKLLDAEDPGDAGGLRSIDMLQTRVLGRERGFRQVHLEPSVRQDIVSPKVGIYMTVNDHFEVSQPQEAVSAAACVQWVFDNLDESVRVSKSILASVQEYAEKL
jgi:hypothetical protein